MVTGFQDKYYIFYELKDGKNYQLFAREIDFKDGSLKGPGQKMLTTTELLSFSFSYDSSRMLINHRMKSETWDDAISYDIIAMYVFDKNLNQIWTDKLKMPYTEKKMNNLEYSVDSKGNVYIVTSVYNDDTTDKRKKDEEEANYHLELLKVAASDRKIAITKADVGDKFVRTLWMYEGPKGEMICAGFYHNARSNGVDGIMTFKLGQDGKMFDLRTNEIPVSVLNQYASFKTQQKNTKKEEKDVAAFDNLDLREIFVQDDGSVILIGEQNFMNTVYNPNSSASSSYTYYYNDMLVTKINSKGKLDWMKKLPKRQRGYKGVGGMSYKYIKVKGTHLLLFLDNVKNKDLPVSEVPAEHRDGSGGFLTAYQINDETGETTKLTLLDTRNVNEIEAGQFAPSRIMPISTSAFVFEAYKGSKEDILIKVDLTK
jgi:hypothetical protein